MGGGGSSKLKKKKKGKEQNKNKGNKIKGLAKMARLGRNSVTGTGTGQTCGWVRNWVGRKITEYLNSEFLCRDTFPCLEG